MKEHPCGQALAVHKSLNEGIMDALGESARYSMQICAEPFVLDGDVYDGFATRYEQIMRFLTTVEGLVSRSYQELSLRFLKDLFFGSLNEGIRAHHEYYHRNLRTYPPFFFRTDEPVPGKIVEVQAPGSGIAQQIELEHAWSGTGAFIPSMSWDAVVRELQLVCDGDPCVLYLSQTSLPMERTLFIKRTEERGIRYHESPLPKQRYAFIKSHAFDNVLLTGHFQRFVKDFFAGHTAIDVPLSVIYTQKAMMALPFDSRTRDYFSDDIRSIFPPTYIVTPNGRIPLRGETFSYDEFCALPNKSRRYFLKYAGPSSKYCFGGRTVYSLARTDKKNCGRLFRMALRGFERSIYWVLQEEVGRRLAVDVVTETGSSDRKEWHARFSGFYGPSGLLGRRVLFRDSFKVPGAYDTAAAPVGRCTAKERAGGNVTMRCDRSKWAPPRICIRGARLPETEIQKGKDPGDSSFFVLRHYKNAERGVEPTNEKTEH